MAAVTTPAGDVVKQKKAKKSSHEKAENQDNAETVTATKPKSEKVKKRKRDEPETAIETSVLKSKKQKKDKKHGSSTLSQAPEAVRSLDSANVSLQDIAFVDTQGAASSSVTAAQGAKAGSATEKEARSLAKKARKESKRLKGQDVDSEQAASVEEDPPIDTDDKRKSRKERKSSQRNGPSAEVKTLEATAEAPKIDISQENTVAASGSETVPQKRSKKAKKEKSTSKSTSDHEVPEPSHDETANQPAKPDAADAADPPTKRKRDPLPDPIVPAKEHRFIVFVGNLPFSATKEAVQQHFKAVHPIAVRLMTDKATGKSKGFGFVEFDRYDYMNSCLQKYHHTHFAPGTPESRRINVELTAGGGGAKEERKNKIKEKNMKLRHEQYRRREKVKDDEYKLKTEGADADADAAKAKAKGTAGAGAGAGAGKTHVPREGIHPSRLGQVKK